MCVTHPVRVYIVCTSLRSLDHNLESVAQISAKLPTLILSKAGQEFHNSVSDSSPDAILEDLVNFLNIQTMFLCKYILKKGNAISI
jgi:hypothetical protein